VFTGVLTARSRPRLDSSPIGGTAPRHRGL